MPATQTQTQMDPAVAHLQALLASLRARLHVFNLIQVGTDRHQRAFFFSTCPSIQLRIRSASCKLLRSCMSMWLLPLIPIFGSDIISASPPLRFTCATNFSQLSDDCFQFAGPPETSPR